MPENRFRFLSLLKSSALWTGLRARRGAVAASESFAITVLSVDRAAQSDMQVLVDAICASYARTAILALSSAPLAGAQGRRLPALWPLRSVAERYLNRSKTRLLLVAGAPSSAQPLMEAARRRGCAVIVVLPHGAQLAGSDKGFRDADACFASTGDHDWMQRAEDGSASPCSLADAVATVARLFSRNPHEQLAKPGASAAAPQSAPPFPSASMSLETLRRALGAPQTILCLGNGPSSEDTRLGDYPAATVFRVNASWQSQARHLMAPDLVFTAQGDVLAALSPRVGFVFKSIVEEQTMAPRLGDKRYAVAERMGCYDPQSFGGHAATHGAVMVATAVALKPQRLVIAGIDLFAHPAGAYPHDQRTVNDYTMGHDRKAEITYLRAVLARFAGELVILSPPLAAALQGAA